MEITLTRPGRPDEPMVLLPVTMPARSLAVPESITPPETNVVVSASRSERGTDFGLLTRSQIQLLQVQLALERMGISSGSIDGVFGGQSRGAFAAYQKKMGVARSDGEIIDELLHALDAPATIHYLVIEEDVSRLQPLGKSWLEKSQQDRMDYESILELVAERFHAHPGLVQKLNPSFNWSDVRRGAAIVVPNVERPAPTGKAASIKIYLGARVLQVFDDRSNLVAHFPCSIAQRVEKRPAGETLHVSALAPHPNYTFDPEVFPESPEARQLDRKLILQPGPNNPVGTVWIGLDKPGYGIHGTPRPEDVGRTESHGCFRLANWNVEYLLPLVSIGTPVLVEP